MFGHCFMLLIFFNDLFPLFKYVHFYCRKIDVEYESNSIVNVAKPSSNQSSCPGTLFIFTISLFLVLYQYYHWLWVHYSCYVPSTYLYTGGTYIISYYLLLAVFLLFVLTLQIVHTFLVVQKPGKPKKMCIKQRG